ncbi:uncharacterized protein N7482_000426 [Penicillium canariense]|uniref:Uncharacterized protein n=1 Tax=Penicillium canariense TaxID=189055 RepID=A0A9W9IBJ8_9EURO|nr:uncharacterized protein N7482_000426 [Penicillium canariense]KAJ5174549.1 hypothetical protein N7482_000426 [Penicillium canariense]
MHGTPNKGATATSHPESEERCLMEISTSPTGWRQWRVDGGEIAAHGASTDSQQLRVRESASPQHLPMSSTARAPIGTLLKQGPISNRQSSTRPAMTRIGAISAQLHLAGWRLLLHGLSWGVSALASHIRPACPATGWRRASTPSTCRMSHVSLLMMAKWRPTSGFLSRNPILSMANEVHPTLYVLTEGSVRDKAIPVPFIPFRSAMG